MTVALDHAPCTRAAIALRRLSATGPWLWLVRPDIAEAAAIVGFVLLHHLPGILVSLEAARGHG
jgi:hypothetical protein